MRLVLRSSRRIAAAGAVAALVLAAGVGVLVFADASAVRDVETAAAAEETQSALLSLDSAASARASEDALAQASRDALASASSTAEHAPAGTLPATALAASASPSAAAGSYPLPDDVRGVVIPATFFGMHLVSVWAPGTVWPPVPVGVYRLLNATPRWHALHEARTRFADDQAAGSGLSRIYAALLFRDQNGSSAAPIYTLGGGDGAAPSGFPTWLRGARADTLAEWRRYVRTVGTRFRGQIRHWEIWNEPDCPCAYGGTTAQLVALTRAAAEELRAIDPANRILAPAFTQFGLDDMDAFLAAGGGAHVDVITWHQDNAAVPERDTTLIERVRGMMTRHGVGHLPLWTTEGHPRLARGGDPVAVMARTHLVLWLFGVKSFHWYAWDIGEYTDIAGPWVTLTERGHADRPTAAGRAYGVVARWLTGARVDALDIDGSRWVVTLTMPDGRPGWIVWRAGPDAAEFAVPAAATRVHTLDGAERAWSGGAFSPVERPVLFR
jgi:hypothetical protein